MASPGAPRHPIPAVRRFLLLLAPLLALAALSAPQAAAQSAPTVTIDLPDAPDHTNDEYDGDRISTNGLFYVNIYFSEDVTGFTSGDISVTNGSVTDFYSSGGSERIYVCGVTPDSSLTGDGSEEISINVPANAADAKAGANVGMGNAAATTATLLYDTVAPTVTMTTTPATLTAASEAFTVTFTFSENVNGFGNNGRPSNLTEDSEVIPDIQVQNGTVGTVTVLDRATQPKPGGAIGNSFQATVTPSSGKAQTDVQLVVSAGAAEDAARNENTRSDVLNKSAPPSPSTCPMPQTTTTTSTTAMSLPPPALLATSTSTSAKTLPASPKTTSRSPTAA